MVVGMRIMSGCVSKQSANYSRSEHVFNDLNFLHGLNELNFKPAVDDRRGKLPKAVDILKSRFAQPSQLFFKMTVIVRSVICAWRRSFRGDEIGFTAARLSDHAVKICISS